MFNQNKKEMLFKACPVWIRNDDFVEGKWFALSKSFSFTILQIKYTQILVVTQSYIVDYLVTKNRKPVANSAVRLAAQLADASSRKRILIPLLPCPTGCVHIKQSVARDSKKSTAIAWFLCSISGTISRSGKTRPVHYSCQGKLGTKFTGF
jgi:hypothetical protein